MNLYYQTTFLFRASLVFLLVSFLIWLAASLSYMNSEAYSYERISESVALMNLGAVEVSLQKIMQEIEMVPEQF